MQCFFNIKSCNSRAKLSLSKDVLIYILFIYINILSHIYSHIHHAELVAGVVSFVFYHFSAFFVYANTKVNSSATSQSPAQQAKH